MVRKIDRLGRIVIPIEIRRKLKMSIGTACEFRVNGTELILKCSDNIVQAVNKVRKIAKERQGICPYCGNELMERFNSSCCGNCGNKIIWSEKVEEDV
ncbi:transcriptional pleiotropic regulator of transition state genes [Lacrimispora sphenoides]|uniref:AbrB/MazE/SpoVT family DNA-binding domain-containing protein n=1 Tax=Lacrimispora sphenoides TaxID=29370 RepID=UPI0008AD3D12|nr:AbrB/MazE/SpoVT family DNA-binding domain-containing protein [Lacrimispora sphenoides]SET42970.1 transcriptional pleiotropic regulator of transition state genes [Lacrimispora sphenoides]